MSSLHFWFYALVYITSTHLCSAETVYDFTVKDINGNTVSLSKYQSKVLLIVNVASQCGYTDRNYKGLQKIYDKFKDAGLAIAAFPCNQFGKQEPWEESEIDQWVKDTFSITFDMYSKVDVKGTSIDPLFEFLTQNQPERGTPIGWNFDGKFLIDRNGNIVKRWTNSAALKEIVQYLKKIFAENKDDL